MTGERPVLVLAAHGTIHPKGPDIFEQLATRVRRRLPDAEVAVAFVDVIGPTLHDVLADVGGDPAGAVVVPVFLGAGYHVKTDIPQIVASYGEKVTVARSLGPAPEVTDAVAARFRQAWQTAHGQLACGAWDHPDVVVLAAAGSTDADSRRQAHTAADHLAAVLGRPVYAGFLTAGTPKVADVVERAHQDGATVGVATYLLGPGTFHDRLRALGVDAVARPIGPHPLLADLVVSRYREAVEVPVASHAGWSSRGAPSAD